MTALYEFKGGDPDCPESADESVEVESGIRFDGTRYDDNGFDKNKLPSWAMPVYVNPDEFL